MEAIFALYGLALFCGAIACAVMVAGSFGIRVARKAYYSATGQVDPVKGYEIHYRVSGDVTVRVRAKSSEEATRKAEAFFEDERFGELQNANHTIVAVTVDGERFPVVEE